MNLPDGWIEQDNALVKEFKFDDFKAAMDFMNRAGEIADKMNHHPEWTNIYNKVSVRLTTHDEGGVTGKDYELAAEMNRVSSE